MTIFKFGAEWCVACKQLDERLKQYKDKIIDVDVGTEEGVALANKYGVNGNIPVVLIVEDDEIERIDGVRPLAVYEKYLKG